MACHSDCSSSLRDRLEGERESGRRDVEMRRAGARERERQVLETTKANVSQGMIAFRPTKCVRAVSEWARGAGTRRLFGGHCRRPGATVT
eukprot:364444-Chlamydomonas_euryale.AAC.2